MNTYPTINELLEEAGANRIALLNCLDAIKRIEKAEEEATIAKENDFIFHNYDAVIASNADRKAKAKKRNKSNSMNHKADRRHGKHRELSRKEQDLIHGGYGAGILWGFRGDKIVPIVSKGSKTNRNRNEKRFDYPMREREIDFLAFDDLFNKSAEIVRQAKKETDPVRKGQLWDLDRDITDAMCVDFYDGWYPDLSVKPERF